MPEPIVKPDASGTSEQQPVPQIPQAEIDKIAAAARREAESKLKEANERLATLEAEKKKREEEELSEVEKLRKKVEEANELYTGVVSERDKLKETVDSINAQTLERVEKEMEGLPDAQKTLINKLPLIDRMDAIAQFKQARPQSGDWGHTTGQGSTSYERVLEVRDKYGPNSPQFMKAYAEYRKSA